MISITLQRDKCIGCNYCAEVCPQFFRMSKKDGKSVLLNSADKKGFHFIKVNHIFEDQIQQAVKVCPVKIITAAIS
ncbi:MAG: ferredoxin [Crocinitomicaceae bacterium]|nr:ferredoxin [Crocinitomicaceae bacterium]